MTMVIVHWLIMCHANYDKIQNGKKITFLLIEEKVHSNMQNENKCVLKRSN